MLSVVFFFIPALLTILSGFDDGLFLSSHNFEQVANSIYYSNEKNTTSISRYFTGNAVLQVYQNQNPFKESGYTFGFQ
jgi:hypothetical protein